MTRLEWILARITANVKKGIDVAMNRVKLHTLIKYSSSLCLSSKKSMEGRMWLRNDKATKSSSKTAQEKRRTTIETIETTHMHVHTQKNALLADNNTINNTITHPLKAISVLDIASISLCGVDENS